MQTNPHPMSKTDLQVRMQRIQDNLQMMQRYFDALFGKDLSIILDMIDDHIEWLIVPTGDTLKGKEQIAKLAPNHWAASPRGGQGTRYPHRACVNLSLSLSYQRR
jgi:ketosteroid isomerase-like protein